MRVDLFSSRLSWLRIAVGGWFLLAGVLAVRFPPRSPRAAGFSVDQARQDLEWIASEPHPVGTRAHGEVVEHIRSEVERLGLHVDVQDGTYVQNLVGNRTRLVRIRNVLAKRDGFSNTRSVVLMAHYDSVIGAPGAGDDGVGVATLIETARSLQSSQLRNDVVFVFTDAEELGLCGAWMFVSEHPWARNIGAILNFEARGVRGRAMLFETGERSGWLVREFLDAVPASYASSLAPTIYQYTRYATDLNVFRGTGVPRLNFAFVEGWQAYHTWRDMTKAVESAAILDEGSYAVGLTTRIGNLDLTTQASDLHELVYFNFGGIVVRYNERLAWIPAILACLVFLGLAAQRYRKGHVRIWQIVLAVLGTLVAVVLTSVAAWAAWRMLTRSASELGSLFDRPGLYTTALAVLALASMVVAHKMLRRFATEDGIALAAMLWFALFAAYSAIWLRGISYVFAWALGGAVILAYGAWGIASTRSIGLHHVLAVVLGSTFVLFVLVPTIDMILLARPTWPFTAVPLMALVFLLMSPGIELALGGMPWRVAAALAVGAVALVGLCLMPGPRGKSPRNQATGVYVASVDAGRAAWLSTEPITMPSGSHGALGTARDIDRYVPTWYDWLRRGGPYLVDAPMLSATAGPMVTIASDDLRGNTRILALRIVSPRLAPEMKICLRSSRGILSASVEEHEFLAKPLEPVMLSDTSNLSQRGCDLIVEYFGQLDHGLPLTVKIPIEAEFHADVADRTYDQTDTEVQGLGIVRALDGRVPASFVVCRRFTWSPAMKEAR